MIHLAVITLLLAQVIGGVDGGDGPRVKTQFGVIQGSYKISEPGSRTFSSFEGIPYAVAPVGSLRFQPPQKIEVFYKPDQPLKATKCGSECPQLDRTSGEYLGSEDCLFLNVFSPETKFLDGVKHPVMVWIHGGAFQFGSSDSSMFGPERILEEDVVLVTMNYRLGPLGFLTTGDEVAPPNVGLLDQRLVLEWVRDNVAAFSGDPDRVTLFGESSGGISVLAHLASPGSQGLFHKAISMSGVWGESPFLHMSKPPSEYTKILAKNLGCKDHQASQDILKCLQEKSPNKILEEASKFAVFDFMPEPFKPVVDSWMKEPMLPHPLHEVWDKMESSKIPIMIGGNKDEGVLFLIQFLKDEKLYTKVNEEFATQLPALLLGVDPEDAAKDEGETATAEVLRDSYLPGDGSFSPDAIDQMVKLFTDVHFLSPIDNVVRKLSNKTEQLYYYNYQHKGSFSLPTAFGIWENYGVSHADELFLLFKFSQVSSSWLGDLALQTEEDFSVQRKLVNIWTQFAKTGKPTEDDSWKSVQENGKLEYAVLDASDLRMEYPEHFGKKMELVQSMMKMARVHRVNDATAEDDHPELAEMRMELARMMEEEWEENRRKVLQETKEKQKLWKTTSQSDDIRFFDDEDEEEFDAVFDDFSHDEL